MVGGGGLVPGGVGWMGDEALELGPIFFAGFCFVLFAKNTRTLGPYEGDS